MKLRNVIYTASALSMALLLSTAATAQNNVSRCSNVKVGVDYQIKPGQWENGAFYLKLQGKGEGWLTEASNPSDRAQVKSAQGEKFRLNFTDGTHMINVKASGSGGIKVTPGAKPATVLVDITKNSGTGALRFDITGSPNDKAKINGCPGGNVYFNIVG